MLAKKFVICTAFAVVSAVAPVATVYAQSSTPASTPDSKFATHKQHELDMIGKRLEALQTLQSCVQAAQDKTAIKTCNQAAKSSMKPAGK